MKINKFWRTFLTFYDEDIPYYSASLSFYTIFTIVPLLLVSFAVFIKFSSFQNYFMQIKHFLFANLLPSNQELISQYLDTFLNNSSGLNILNALFIIIASLMFFQNYEYIVSKIFKSRQKTIFNAITTYWTLITLGPLALALSFYLSIEFQRLLSSYEYTSSINFLAILPYFIIWFLFFIAYKISTTTPVMTRSAFLSSFVTSAIWYGSKSLFVIYATHNKTYSTIYGSFSVILFFLFWIYISWMIFLYGLKVCYLINEKNKRRTYKKIKKALKEDRANRESEVQEKDGIWAIDHHPFVL